MNKILAPQGYVEYEGKNICQFCPELYVQYLEKYLP